MKKQLIGVTLLTLLILLLNSCSEQEPFPQADEMGPTGEAELKTQATARKQTGKYLVATITGTIDGFPILAEFRVTSFLAQQGQLYAAGYVANVGVGVPGEFPPGMRPIDGEQIMLPAALIGGAIDSKVSALAACDVLFVQLGPADLNLLEQAVHINQSTLSLEAETDSSNSLDNLLCAIVRMLDAPGSLPAIVKLLNQIINLIGILP